ncbi:restriction endonuclease [Apilactobacillus sp. TMW 2.2459]|uniref:restriction endonuclease n=2 Tax=Apilactobacillus xinyiensis TaxID=2841032 RepID=UPI00200FB859|nr:restriction endonuclease [Apilactobacillus xinyiensis]MCL0312275.1 restriction endonuclease [Apilactobacillus xinyiensis]
MMKNDYDFYYHNKNYIRKSLPSILKIILIDRTMYHNNIKKNIIWANNNYTKYGPSKIFSPNSQIVPSIFNGMIGEIIKPRALKSTLSQKIRTKSNAEVFTPIFIVKRQNDLLDQKYKNDDLETYVKRKCMEISCGEAPYLATRYDMLTGKYINVQHRVGILDRKIKLISSKINNQIKWEKLVIDAYKSVYGFEWNGDSLFLARENLLYTYIDYYVDKFSAKPSYNSIKKVANIISYNIFQMDGIKFIIPLTDKESKTVQLSLFESEFNNKVQTFRHGIKAQIMNWDSNKMEFFKG